MPAIVINKIPYDFHNSSLDLMYNGESIANIEGLTEFSYSDTVERTKLRGRSRKTIAMTDGEYDAEASVTLYRYAYDQIIEVCRDLGIGIFDLTFTANLIYAHTDQLVRNDVITGCKFAGREFSGSMGTDPLTVVLPISVGGEIISDGVPAMA